MSPKLLVGVMTGLLAAAASGAHGASIASYNFTSGLGASTVDPNAIASGVTVGTAVNSPTATNDFWISKPVISFSRANDTAAQVYFQATLTAASGYELNLDSFSFDGARGGAATPRSYEVHSSVAGLLNDATTFPTSTSLTSGTFDIQRGPTGSTDSLPTITTDLSSAAYDHLTSLTMRVYFYTPTTNQNIDIDNVIFNGNVFAVGGSSIGTWNVPTAGDWTASGNWSGGVPNGVDAEARFLSAIGSTRTVYADNAVTVGTMRFNNANTYHVTGGGSLTMQVSTGSALIQVQAGTHKINLPLIIASNTDLNVATGATLKISDPVTVNAGKSLTQAGPGSGTVTYESTLTLLSGAAVTFGSSSHLARLDLGPTASATVAQSGGLKSLKLDNLVLNGSSKIDLKDNKLISASPAGSADINGVYSGVQGDVQRAFNGGAWDQPGLTTSMPDAQIGLTSIGVATGEQLRGLGPNETDTFAGQTINGASTIAMYTYGGDANLDGLISGDDYSTIDFNVGTSADGWYNGDFNYDGIISGDDYSTIDFNYSAQGAPFPASAGIISSGVTAVPEPTLVSLLLAPLAAMLRRRRQRLHA